MYKRVRRRLRGKYLGILLHESLAKLTKVSAGFERHKLQTKELLQQAEMARKTAVFDYVKTLARKFDGERLLDEAITEDIIINKVDPKYAHELRQAVKRVAKRGISLSATIDQEAMVYHVQIEIAPIRQRFRLEAHV